jgi:hypothetical protein
MREKPTNNQLFIQFINYYGAGCGWCPSRNLLQWAIQLQTHHNNHAYLRLYSAVCAPDDGCI